MDKKIFIILYSFYMNCNCNLFISNIHDFWACVYSKINVFEINFIKGMYFSEYFENTPYSNIFWKYILTDLYGLSFFLCNDKFIQSCWLFSFFFTFFIFIFMINFFLRVNTIKVLLNNLSKKSLKPYLGAGAGSGYPLDASQTAIAIFTITIIIAVPVLIIKYVYPDFKNFVVQQWRINPEGERLARERTMREIVHYAKDSPKYHNIPDAPKHSEISIFFDSYFSKIEPYFSKILAFLGANFTIYFLFSYFLITLYLFNWILKRFKAIYPEIKRQQSIKFANDIKRRMAEHKEDQEVYLKARLASTAEERKKLMKEYKDRFKDRPLTVDDIWKFP